MANLSLDIGLKALLTSQAALDTIGHNIANANTPGYSRQTLHVSNGRAQTLRGLRIGDGVDADFVKSGSYQIEVAGERFAARASLRPLYDPKAERVKA